MHVRICHPTKSTWVNQLFCSASFHPLTNRKHHCRLCGRIICSLPVKHPQRPQTCSLLFVADPITGQIEEVGEGVDYGVRRRTTSTAAQSKGKGRQSVPTDDEKFLKGVRICRDCRPTILYVLIIHVLDLSFIFIRMSRRRQYMHEIHHTPMFSKLYDVSSRFVTVRSVLSSSSIAGVRDSGERDRGLSSTVPGAPAEPQQRRASRS